MLSCYSVPEFMTTMPIIAVAGPTASGKTALAVFLAERIDAEIVNFDSVQIYRGIEIATAKPTREERRGIPHHLIDYVDPNIDYTAADWAKDAETAIRDIESRGKRRARRRHGILSSHALPAAL